MQDCTLSDAPHDSANNEMNDLQGSLFSSSCGGVTAS